MRNFRTFAGLACVIAAMTSFSVSAATCATLEYAELQDMSVPELNKEFCSAALRAEENLETVAYTSLDNLVSHEHVDEAALAIVQSQADQCKNQAERIKKMLVRKSVDESSLTYAVCKGKP